MAGRRVLADTSLFIEYLRARDKTATHLFNLTRMASVETVAIVAAEIFYGARKIDSEARAFKLLDAYPVHSFTRDMAARQSSMLRELIRMNQMIEIRDSMIAAAAIELSLPIATLNRSHFFHIPGLILEDLPT